MEENRISLAKIKDFIGSKKRYAVYVGAPIITLVYYFRGLLGDKVGHLIPAAILMLIIVLYDTIENIERSYARSLKPRYFNTFAEALPELVSVVAHDKEVTTIEYLGASGGSAVAVLLPLIQYSNAATIEVNLYLIDPESQSKDMFAGHWIAEREILLKRMEEGVFSNDRTRLKIYSYRHLPVVSGMMVNGKHLCLGFLTWSESEGGKVLSSAENPHIYFASKEDPDADYFFKLFLSWSRGLPVKDKKLIYSRPFVISREEIKNGEGDPNAFD